MPEIHRLNHIFPGLYPTPKHDSSTEKIRILDRVLFNVHYDVPGSVAVMM